MKCKITEVKFQVPGAAALGDVQKEAIKQSMEFECDVEFKHNGIIYRYIFKNLIGCADTEEKL